MTEKGFYDIEEHFYQVVDEVKRSIPDIKNVDVVIGIPFYNEEASLFGVIEAARQSFPEEKRKKLIVCVGDPAGEKAIEVVRQRFADDVVSFLMPEGVNGRGFSIRAILELARTFDADVVLLEADLGNRDGHGIKPRWIDKLANPIFSKYDISIASFRRHPFEDTVGTLVVSPLLSSLYGTRLSDPLSGVYGISHDIVQEICSEFDQSSIKIGGYGFNPWLITTVLRLEKQMSEVNLGAKLSPMNFGKKNLVMKEMLRAFFDCMKRDEDLLLHGDVIVKGLDTFGAEDRDLPLDVLCDPMEFARLFKEGCDHYDKLLGEVLGTDMAGEIKDIADLMPDIMDFPPEQWARSSYRLILTYCSKNHYSREDILELTITLYNGMLASYLKYMIELQEILKGFDIQGKAWFSAMIREFSMDCHRIFLEMKPDFQREFTTRLEKTRLPLIPLDYLEFIPGVPIVLPKTLVGLGGREIVTVNVFKRLQKKYDVAFKDFLTMLGITSLKTSEAICDAVQNLMKDVQKTIDAQCPGDLLTRNGTVEAVNSIFNIFSRNKINSIKEEVLHKLLVEFPPHNLILKLGYRSLEEMMEREDIRSVMTLAGFTEDKDYLDKVYFWLQDNLRPDSFEKTDLKPLVVERSEFQGLGEVRQISDLNRLTARIAVMNLNKGTGGSYPKLRYFTRIAKSIIEAEHFSELVESYARGRKEVGRKFINSILGHYGKAMFSAHHIFENWHHRVFVKRLWELSVKLAEDGQTKASRDIAAMAKGYGLSMVLRDGTFLPCSVWTWASFSFQGGEGIPTPMFLRVERDWFNHDLLEELYREMGYKPSEIMSQIFQLISQGRESIDLAGVILGVKPPHEEIVIQELSNWPRAGMLLRHPSNPILDPIKEHTWENRFVLNTAALDLRGKTYLMYRAFGDDKKSRVGLAVVRGGEVAERLDYPIFEPGMEQEKEGCEDPRTVIIEDDIFMLYTAYDGVVAQIAAASIPVEDFINRDFDRWVRRGLAFPGLWDKDAILFPEKIKGKYVIYHRIEPSIWIAYSDELVFPWPTDGHKIIMGPRSGMMWDSLKIGAGAQPIKTKYGWLLIYHGVDQEMVYSLGVMLVDLEDPGKIFYRSPNPILTPETECEIGRTDECWVPNVVFTCGAVPEVEKEILEDDDKILIYYGAADTNICLATGTVADLIPEAVRKKLQTRKKTARQTF